MLRQVSSVLLLFQGVPKKNWKRIHKRVCTTDPELRPFIPVEMAAERILALYSPLDAPTDAKCYVCLEGETESSKLMRVCACRGDSAGFVHLGCLVQFAVSKEPTSRGWTARDCNAVRDGWTTCVNCKHQFMGDLGLEMRRALWRRHRSADNGILRYMSRQPFITCLKAEGEFEAALTLYSEVIELGGGNEPSDIVAMNLCRAQMLQKPEEALDIAKATLPDAKKEPQLYSQAMGIIGDFSSTGTKRPTIRPLTSWHSATSTSLRRASVFFQRSNASPRPARSSVASMRA